MPVYGLASLVDAFILNSVEFWTDENPMDTVLNDAESSVAISRMENGTIRIETGGSVCLIERTDSGVCAKLLYTSTTYGPLVKITDTNGHVVNVFLKS